MKDFQCSASPGSGQLRKKKLYTNLELEPGMPDVLRPDVDDEVALLLSFLAPSPNSVPATASSLEAASVQTHGLEI